jgi:hypothetical protein
MVACGQRDESLRPYSLLSRPTCVKLHAKINLKLKIIFEPACLKGVDPLLDLVWLLTNSVALVRE